MALLKMNNGSGQCIELKGDACVIGRAPECDIVLDPNGVSRRHAEIRRQGEQYVVDDMHSRNTTKVNNAVLVPGKAHILKEGDVINICDVEFSFHTSRESAVAVPKPDAGEMQVTDYGGESLFHMQDASVASSHAVAAVRPEIKLGAILEITRHLSNDLNIDSVAPKVLDSLFEIFPQVERGFLVLSEGAGAGAGAGAGQKLVRKAFKHRKRNLAGRRSIFGGSQTPEDEAPMSISRSIVNHVIGQKKALLSQDAGADANLPTSASIADLKIRSIMCAPLITTEGKVLGILQLDTSDRKQFGQEDLDLLVTVAGQASIAVENATMHQSLLARERLDRDLQIAEQVQKRFLPRHTPQIEGYEFYAHYDPAYEVGGDYYDFVRLSDDRLAIAVGDVSGKGVSAALMMAKFSGDTRYAISTNAGPGGVASRLNTLLCEAEIEEKFITLGLVFLNPLKRSLMLASAGHLPLLIRRGDGSIDALGDDVAGFPLGVDADASYSEVEIALNPGDVAVLHSDGVTDARNKAEELFDSRDNPRLKKRLAESAGGPEAVGKSILQAVREFSAGHRQADDITLVCFGPV